MHTEEWGGALPLEYDFHGEYYNSNRYNLLKTNSCRAAIWVVLKQIAPKRVIVPHYICDSVYDTIDKCNIQMVKYFVDTQFYPVDICPKKEDCLIIVNYFGCCETQIKNILSIYSDINIILDNSQAFFNKPEQNVFSVYSPRKFFGVPDGGYLINDTCMEIAIGGNRVLVQDTSYSRVAHILKPIELTTHSAYADFKENERYLSNNYMEMSKLTEYLLCGIEYKSVMNRRKENFSFIHDRFKHINKIQLPKEAVPYIYPLLTAQNLITVKQFFINNGYYASTLWEQHLKSEYNGTFEQKMAKNCLFIPIDQRYNVESLTRLCSLITSKIGE